jgi:hypothetical protein
MSQPLDYTALVQQLDAAELPITAAEVHGIVTGALCAGIPASEWRTLILGRAPASEAVATLLATVYAQTVAQLDSEELDFAPLLPDADESLTQQAEGLSEWCRGFLLGFGSGRRSTASIPGGVGFGVGRRPLPQLSDEAREVLDDMQQLAELDPETEEDEEAARALAELAEYLRVGVQLIYEETHPTPTAH